MNIVQFSGGKDSTCMLLMMLENNVPVDEIIFCDTGMEFPQMYEHIRKVEEYISSKYGKTITVLKPEKSFEYYLTEYTKTRGKYKDIRGLGWATPRIRWCTSKLKVEVVRKYLKSLKDHTLYIGIAFDEPKRHIRKENNVIHYLYDNEITEADALEYCYRKGFKWGGLYEDFRRVSCWCCPLKSIDELRTLYKKYPTLWQKLKGMDKKSNQNFYNPFKADYTLADLEKRFQIEERMGIEFKKFPKRLLKEI